MRKILTMIENFCISAFTTMPMSFHRSDKSMTTDVGKQLYEQEHQNMEKLKSSPTYKKMEKLLENR